jgi:sensor histidine kinase regulating citrate/malate metabolism
MDKHLSIVQAIWLHISCSFPHRITTIRYLFVTKEFNAYTTTVTVTTTTTTNTNTTATATTTATTTTKTA